MASSGLHLQLGELQLHRRAAIHFLKLLLTAVQPHVRLALLISGRNYLITTVIIRLISIKWTSNTFFYISGCRRIQWWVIPCVYFFAGDRHVVDDTMHRCHDTVSLMYAEVPEDYEALGDSHQPAGVSQETNTTSPGGKNPLPWSWSAYRKESACESELRFIQPHVAQDRLGRWRIIVQTTEFPQRVAIDVCRRVDDVCKVFTDCGRKSRCVQRYSYQPLISIDQDKRQAGACPTMAIFRFPTSCVCHVEVDKPQQGKSNRRN